MYSVERFGHKRSRSETDNKQAIVLVVSELVPPQEAMAVVLDICFLARLEDTSFSWVHRTANEVAHRVAALALKGDLPLN